MHGKHRHACLGTLMWGVGTASWRQAKYNQQSYWTDVKFVVPLTGRSPSDHHDTNR